MPQLPEIKLKSEREELAKLMFLPFLNSSGQEMIKADLERNVRQMSNRTVLDCLSVIKG